MTTTIKLKAARKKGDKTTPTVHYRFGDDLHEAQRLFGPDVIHALFIQAARQQLSEWARKRLMNKKSPTSVEDLQRTIGEWKPTIKRRGKTPLEKAQAEFDALNDDDKAKLAVIAARFAAPPPLSRVRTADEAMVALKNLPQNVKDATE